MAKNKTFETKIDMGRMKDIDGRWCLRKLGDLEIISYRVYNGDKEYYAGHDGAEANRMYNSLLGETGLKHEYMSTRIKEKYKWNNLPELVAIVMPLLPEEIKELVLYEISGHTAPLELVNKTREKYPDYFVVQLK